MDKSLQSDTDIADEQYKGPGAVAAGAGEGFVSHFKWAITGLIVGGVAGALLPGKVNELIKTVQKLAGSGAEHANFITRWPSKALRFVVGHGAENTEVKQLISAADTVRKIGEPEYLVLRKHALHKEKGMFYSLADELLFFIPRDVKKKLMGGSSGDRINAGAIAGGMLASIGYFIVPLFSFGKGTEKAHAGKRQLERAQEEIIRLRSERASPEVTVPEAVTPTTKVAQASIDVTPETTFNAAASQAIAATKKGDNGWADGVTAQKDTKVSAEPAMA